MPELPEIEVISQKLKLSIVNHIIRSTKVYNEKLRKPISQEILKLKNKIILDVYRLAKYLILKLNKGFIIIHFGMSGNLKLLKQNIIIKKSDLIDLFLSDNLIIRYSDYRRFGICLWSNDDPINVLLNLGIDPLDKKFDGNWLYNKLQNSKTKIKSWLMNNKMISGIGNIYANEVLFLAKIAPNRITNKINRQESYNIVNSIKYILSKAIFYGGTTIKDFRHPDGELGSFKKKLKVYGKNGTNCLVCNDIIEVIKQNNRSTFFCPNCQKI